MKDFVRFHFHVVSIKISEKIGTCTGFNVVMSSRLVKVL